MIANHHCDSESLSYLLAERTSEGDKVFAHVESCGICQNRLDALSQGELSWEEVTELLAPNHEPYSSVQLCSKAQADLANGHGESGLEECGTQTGFLSPSESSDSLGRFARFEIVEILGRGGMGIVMRALDTQLNRYSAVKVLAPELASSAAARQRFSREARSAAAVVHPHVVPIQTVDEHQGIPYLVMPVVEGKSVEARVQKDGPLSVVEVVRIAAQVADGLAAAHGKGLVHRDIKPANILLENGVERVKITDFGLARAIDDASMTRSGVISGTPQYMSPEQAHGDSIDHRSDLFSLGSLMYYMLAGRSPFRAETTMGVLNRIGHDQPKSIRSINADVPQWLDEIVTKLIEKDPDARFQSAAEVAGLLNGWLAHLQQPGVNPPPKPQVSSSEYSARHRRYLLVGLGFALVAVCSFFIFSGEPGQKSSPDEGPSVNDSSGVSSNDDDKKKAVVKKKAADIAGLKGLSEKQKELWRVPLGSFTMRAPVIDDDHIYVSTNNGHGYLKRFPFTVDMGVLLCFSKKDGKFLWQHSNAKLPTGRIHDWPQFGITSRPCIEGDRLWYVTNRAEIVCLDTKGFRDGENDGPVKDEEHTGLDEADVIWRMDMMKELGVRPHNVSTCTIAVWRDRIFAVTGNGVGLTHRPPLADAPSFIAVDKQTGRLLWQDSSPGQNVLHGQWGSPTIIENGPVKSQVVFPGGDGWLYSFDPRGTMDGKSKLLWKFDCNPKKSNWQLGGRGSRNNLIHGPTLHDGLLYIATGQDPEHGMGPGGMVCLKTDGTGDVSSEIVYNDSDPTTPIAHKREQACVESEGDFTRPNPNSRLVWRFDQQDVNGDGKVELHEKLTRSISTIAIKDDLLFVSDTEGILHCLNRKTGKQHWGFDLLTNVYSTPVIVGDRVYVGTSDGEIVVFACSADLKKAAPKGKPIQRIECTTSVNASVVADGKILYFTTQKELIAIENN